MLQQLWLTHSALPLVVRHFQPQLFSSTNKMEKLAVKPTQQRQNVGQQLLSPNMNYPFLIQ